MSPTPLDHQLQIITETSEWICVNKPACWLSVPSRDQNEQRPIAGLQLQKRLNVSLFPVHRLDYEVSGLLIFAKNKKMQAVLNAEFEIQTARKFYLALTTEPMNKADFTPAAAAWVTAHPNVETESVVEWACKLERGKRRAYETPHGKTAVTQAKCLGKYEHGQWIPHSKETMDPCQNIFPHFHDLAHTKLSHAWQLQPLTGRSHQLRYEMFRHGCPILGDVLYGYPQKNMPSNLPGIALCHFQIEMKTLGILRLF